MTKLYRCQECDRKNLRRINVVIWYEDGTQIVVCIDCMEA